VEIMIVPKTITVHDRSFEVEPGAQNRFWKRVNRGAWEPETFAIFDRHIGDETLFLDVGAWIGSTALYGAQRARFCVAFEPDPVAFAALTRNVAANAAADWASRLEIHDCAINADGQAFTLGGTSEGADSTSSALFPDRESQWTVRAMRLPDVLARHRSPGQPVFLKIDIEGGEFSLLPAIREIIADPLVTAFVSFHSKMLRNALASADAEAWQQPYVDRHLAVLDSLPWTRRITLQDGQKVTRTALERALRRRFRFPEELLIANA
jgi:FkbM family methyltransferase